MVSLPDGNTGQRIKTAVLNPIWRSSFRARLRWRHVFSWGTVVLSFTTFICLIIYLTATQQESMAPQAAAKLTIVPLIAIQSVILMLMGTGAVASGMAIQREKRLLDYHRMTPMSPLGKIIGFLFGLPIREYALFGMTVPFVVWAVIVSELPVGRVLHFYGVFFTSILVYHMTGLVAGMVTRKPRRAVITSTGMVLLLYVILPQLSFLGLNLFEFLTIRPTLYGMIAEELSAAGTVYDNPELLRFSGNVAFFNTSLHPTTYTLIVQSFLVLVLFVVLHRKWRHEHAHAFSKGFCLMVYAGTLTFMVGNIWPLIIDDYAYDKLMEQFRGNGPPPIALLTIILVVMSILCGALIAFLVHVVTASRDTIGRGYRRVRKLNLHVLNPNADAASSLPVAGMMIVLTVIASWVLINRAEETHRFFELAPTIQSGILPLLLFASIIVFVQGVRERLGSRAFIVVLFLFWMIPMFAAMIMWAAFEEWSGGMWVALPCPPVSQALSIMQFIQDTLSVDADMDLPEEIQADVPMMIRVATFGYMTLAALMQIELRRWRRNVKRVALQTMV